MHTHFNEALALVRFFDVVEQPVAVLADVFGGGQARRARGTRGRSAAGRRRGVTATI